MTERLVVSRSNPRYFEPASSDGSGPAVYLSGSHVNNNFHDGAGPGLDCADVPEVFDFGAYLEVICKFDDDRDASVTYAYKAESDAPQQWDAIARLALEAAGQ